MRLFLRKTGFLFALITLLVLGCGVQSALMKTNDLNPDTEIVFPDRNLEDQIREVLGSFDAPITIGELGTLTELKLTGVSSLEGLPV